MTAEEELANLRKRNEADAKKLLSRARVTATTFGILAITALISLVYAFFQQEAADRARIEAEKTMMMAVEQTSSLKKQIQLEQVRLLVCEKTVAELQASKAKQGK